MAMIYVRAKQGRAAFYEGRVIPHDEFIPVTDDPYIRRLIHHWEDLEVQGEPSGAGSPDRSTRRRPQRPTSGQTEPSPYLAPGTGAPKPQN